MVLFLNHDKPAPACPGAPLDPGQAGSHRRQTAPSVAALGSAAARLLRAYATQVEVLRRLRHGGQQYVRVEHVYVNDGGQAVIGNVKQSSKQRA
jgi:hypothetical protein